MWLLLVSFTSACLIALAGVPIVRHIARRFGIVDQPDADRKLHANSIALGGGIAVFIAMLIGTASTLLFDHLGDESTFGSIDHKWFILIGAAFAILAVGLLDDCITLRGRQKLLLQCLIIAVVIGNGTLISHIGILNFQFELGALSLPITFLWLIVAINALNLIDGADGMATTVGSIVAAGIGLIACREGISIAGCVCFALSGALAGFFVFNRPPASIFLGDAGSMMIGLFVGVLAIWSSAKETTVLASAPVAVLAIPLFDSTAAVLRRWLTGRSIYMTDRGHLHHLLQAKYGSHGMLVVVALLSLFTTTLAVISAMYNLPWLALVGVLAVVGALVVTRSFGHAEARLLSTKAVYFLHSFSKTPRKLNEEKLNRKHSLQGRGAWEKVWEPLVEFARSQEFATIKIDLNLSWLHEGYHASWQSGLKYDKPMQLMMCIPLFTERTRDGSEMVIGRLEINAPAASQSVYDRVSLFSDYLAELQPQIDHVIESLQTSAEPDSGIFQWPRKIGQTDNSSGAMAEESMLSEEQTVSASSH